MTNEELKNLRVKMGDFPILREKTQELLEKIVKTLKPNMVLELGSGKGFSGCAILSAFDKANLLTIEKEKENYQDAMENYVLGEFYSRVLPVNADAEQVVESLAHAESKQKFDLIVLDCNKSSYVRMLDNLIELLSPNGVLFADDVLYLGKVLGEGEVPAKKHRTIVVNMRKFIDKVKVDKRLKNVVLYELDDGVIVAVKKTDEEIESTNIIEDIKDLVRIGADNPDAKKKQD